MAKQTTAIVHWGDVVTLRQDKSLGVAVTEAMKEVLGSPQRYELITELPVGTPYHSHSTTQRLLLSIDGLFIETEAFPNLFCDAFGLCKQETREKLDNITPHLAKRHKVGLVDVNNLRAKLVATTPSKTT